jgi:hypothetical protein
MFNDFWRDAEIISVYTDDDAIDDGFLIDVAALSVSFNEKPVNRLTPGAAEALNFDALEFGEKQLKLSAVSGLSLYDGEGEDAWGVCQTAQIASGKRLWLIPNELDGYTLMLPEEY